MERRKKTKAEARRKEDQEKGHEKEILANAGNDKKIGTRGRIFEGTVTRKLPTRLTIEFERMIYSSKFERYFKSKTKIHAHLSKCMENEIKIGDLIAIQECRPLSKLIHFVVIKKIKSAEENK